LHHRKPHSKSTQPSNVASHHHRLVEEKDILDEAALVHPSFNKLKFVNRQLRAETAGLELQFNPVFLSPYRLRAFKRNPNALDHRRIKKPAKEWFFSFVVHCVTWLTTVIIASDLHV
jgi:hypothetical protein